MPDVLRKAAFCIFLVVFSVAYSAFWVALVMVPVTLLTNATR